MLAHVPAKRASHRSSFKRLIDYITRRNTLLYQERMSLHNTHINQTFGLLHREHHPFVSCEHNNVSLKHACTEMEAVALYNTRVKDPVYHFIISWSASESPTDEQAFDSARYSLQALGMSGHQYVCAIHRDTNNTHLHVAVNRVHPTTYKSVYPKKDYFTLDYAMRELELKYGWKHDKGAYAVVKFNGTTKIDWASKTIQTKEKIPTSALAMEVHQDRESLFSYVRDKPRKAIWALLKQEQGITWLDLHRLLATYDLAIKERGQGLVIYDRASNIMLKASDIHETLSKNKLVTLLGDFIPVETSSLLPEERYNPLLPTKRKNPNEREASRILRAIQREDLKKRYQKYKEEVKPKKLDKSYIVSHYDAIRLRSKEKWEKIKTLISNPSTRQALYSILAFETAREKYALKRLLKEQQIALNADNLKTMTYQQWVQQQAENGDKVAVAQIRGWDYAKKRKVRLR